MSPAARAGRRPILSSPGPCPAHDGYDDDVKPSEGADIVIRMDDPRHPAARGLSLELDAPAVGLPRSPPPNVLLAVGAAVLGSACQTLVPLIARQIVDNVIVAHRDALWPWLVLLFVAAAIDVRARLRPPLPRRPARARRCSTTCATPIHDHLQHLDLATLGRLPTGQLVSRANSDTALVQGCCSFLPLMTGNLLDDAAVARRDVRPLAAAGRCSRLLVLPALFAVSYRMRRRVFPATWDGQQREGDVAQIVDEGVTGVRVVKAFGQEQRELDRLADAAQQPVRLADARRAAAGALPAAARGDPDPRAGGGPRRSAGCSRSTARSRSAPSWPSPPTSAQFVAPARQLAGDPHRRPAGPRRGRADLPAARPAPAHRRRARTPSTCRRPRARSTSTTSRFGFDADAPVLDGFDLHIAAGERVALVGASGSGKSTLAALMSRFHDPTAGRGVDRRARRARRHAALAAPTASASRSRRASCSPTRSAPTSPTAGRTRPTRRSRRRPGPRGPTSFIAELPAGYDTVVGERGLTLSGGQRQRIALARAILADPRVLVLDDATSAIDARTEEAIHDGLRDGARRPDDPARRPPASRPCTSPTASSCSTAAGSSTRARTTS